MPTGLESFTLSERIVVFAVRTVALWFPAPVAEKVTVLLLVGVAVVALPAASLAQLAPDQVLSVCPSQWVAAGADGVTGPRLRVNESALFPLPQVQT